MDGSQKVFASTNQHINNESIEENASCNIYTGTFTTNRDLVQHLNFCRRRYIANNGSQTKTTSDGNKDNTKNSSRSKATKFQIILKVKKSFT